MARVADFIYRAISRGVLSRPPEPAAVALGQAGLRWLPLDRLPVFRSPDPRLAVTLGGVRLPHPPILSSMYYALVILQRAMGLGFGAVTTKSITLGPRPGHPRPNLVRIETGAGPGLINCKGVPHPGLGAYRAALPSPPNPALVYQWSQKPGELGGLFKAVRGATTKPLIVKLSPDFSEANEDAIIPAALEHGIRLVNYGNTRRVTEPRLSQG